MNALIPFCAMVKRELLTGLRSPRPYSFVTVLVALLMAGLCLLMVAFTTTVDQFGAVGPRVSRSVLMVFGLGLYSAAALLIPPIAAVSICVEKQQESLELVRMTYVRPLTMALAKLLGVFIIYGLVFVACLPLVGILFFFIGVDWTQFLATLLVCLFSAVSLAAIGVACSAICYRTLPAMFCAFSLGALTHGVPLVALAFVIELSVPRSSGFYVFVYRTLENHLDLFATLIPVLGLFLVAENMTGTALLLGTPLFHLAIVVIALAVAVRILHRPTRPIRVPAGKPIDDRAALEARRKRFPYYLVDPLRRRPDIPDGYNPIRAKENQTGVLSQVAFRIRIVVVCTVLSFLVAVASIYNLGYRGPRWDMVSWPLVLNSLVLAALTPPLVSTFMAREWEWQNMDSLRCTLLSGTEIFHGKLRAALDNLWLLFAGIALGSSPLLLAGFDRMDGWLAMGMGLISILVTVFYVLSLSALASVVCRRSLAGLLWGYGAACAVILLPPPFASVVDEIFTWSARRPEEAPYAFLSPLYAHYATHKDITYGGRDSHPYLAWMAYTTAFTLLSWQLLRLANRRFVRCLRSEAT